MRTTWWRCSVHDDAYYLDELRKLFDEELGSTIDDPEGCAQAETRFIDYCLIVVDEAKCLQTPATNKKVRKQLANVAKALEAMGPEARDHIEQQLGYRVEDVRSPGPIGEMLAAVTEEYAAGSIRSAQKRHLLGMAQAIWPGRVSKYRDSRFGRFVSYLAALAGTGEITDDLMRHAVDPDTDDSPSRIHPHAI